MDTTSQVVLGGIFTSLMSTIGVVVVAFMNNRRERTEAASEGVEAVMQERLEYKDEIIAGLEKSNSRKEEVIQRLRAELRKCREGVTHE